MSTTLITNGIVVDAGTMRPLDILISGERVESLLPRGSEVRADRVIDASGRYVLPGIIDAHNHPVYADRIDRLSRAALSGGVTTVIPYIGAVAAWGKQGGLVQAIDDFIREGETGSCIDFGLHCTLTANVMEEADEAIPELVARGVISFKAFTSYRKRGMKLEDDQILHLMELVAREKALLAFHAENDAILEYLEAKAVAEGREHPRDYPATHPNISEAEAIFRVLSLASVAGCNIYLPHVTCKESLEAIRLFRKWGTVPTLFAETCPHYLTLDDSQLALRGNLAKMSPPLRKEADREALWEAIRNGEIQVVASDAAGHATAANEPLFAETFRAPHGAPGVDTLFCVTWNEGIAKGRVAIPDLVRLLCENPAKCFGLYPRKGTLLPGSDADVVIVDPGDDWIIPDRNEHMAVDYSLFAGMGCLGRHRTVLLRGAVAYEDGKILDDARRGVFLHGSLPRLAEFAQPWPLIVPALQPGGDAQHFQQRKKEAARPHNAKAVPRCLPPANNGLHIWRSLRPQIPAGLQAPPASRWRITATSSQSGKRGQFAQTIQTRWGNRSLLTTPKPFRSKKRT